MSGISIPAASRLDPAGLAQIWKGHRAFEQANHEFREEESMTKGRKISDDELVEITGGTDVPVTKIDSADGDTSDDIGDASFESPRHGGPGPGPESEGTGGGGASHVG